jgi:hypothetical protein
MNAFLSLFLVGTVWFWFTLAVVSLLIWLLEEMEQGIWATMLLVVAVFVIDRCNSSMIRHYLTAHSLHLVLYAALYFGAGTAWCVTKWRLFVHNNKRKYKELKAEFCTKYRLDKELPIPKHDGHDSQWRDTIHNAELYDALIVNPQVKEYKADILRWMSYWPMSFTWTLMNDPVVKLFRAIYNKISVHLQAISDRAFADTKADLSR